MQIGVGAHASVADEEDAFERQLQALTRVDRMTGCLLAERGDEAHENESGPDSDQEPGKEVVQQDAEADAHEDSANEGGTAVGVTTSWISARWGVHSPPLRRCREFARRLGVEDCHLVSLDQRTRRTFEVVAR